MKDKRIKIIINPTANMNKAWRHAQDLLVVLEEYGKVDWAGSVFPTHAKELAKEAAEAGYDIVIAAGGDGTVHEVVNGLMQVPAEKRPALGVLPLGSGNDFAYAIGMPTHPKEAMKAILNGKTRKVDIATVEDEHGRHRYWDNSINIGFGGSVNIYSHNLPIVRGMLMYLVAVILTIVRHYDILDVKIKTDQEEWEQQTMLFGLLNGPREGGGFLTGPDAVVDDGELDYTILSKISRLMMFRMIPEFMNGTQGRFDFVKTGRMKSIEIKSKQPMHLHVDGETYAGFASNVHELTIGLLPQALEVIVPLDA